MKAGRELDALVAEKVMGWDGRQHGEHYFGPSYSTSIAAAWEVVEKFCRDSRSDENPFVLTRAYSMDQEKVGPASRAWWAEFLQHEDRFEPHTKFEACAETAPLAICLAALKACEIAEVKR